MDGSQARQATGKGGKSKSNSNDLLSWLKGFASEAEGAETRENESRHAVWATIGQILKALDVFI
jgi:hypothetical protein